MYSITWTATTKNNQFMRRELPFSIPLTISVCIAYAIDLKIAHAIGNLWKIWRLIIRLILLFHYRCFSGQCIVKFTGRCMALGYAHFTFVHFVTQCHTNYQRLCSAYGSINCLISWKFDWNQSENKSFIWIEMIKGSSSELLKVITIRRFSLSLNELDWIISLWKNLCT